jgi:tetratricopeptide (TPR) repeat protein
VHGTDHPHVASSVSKLGRMLFKQGDYVAAAAHHERALAIFESVHGTDHPHVAISLSLLGRALEWQGDYAAVALNYERALTIGETLIKDHPDIAISREGLACIRVATTASTGAS